MLNGDIASLQKVLETQQSTAMQDKAEHAEACTALRASLEASNGAALAELAEWHRHEMEEQAHAAAVQQQTEAAANAARMEEARRDAAGQQARLEARTEELEEYVAALQLQLEKRCAKSLVENVHATAVLVRMDCQQRVMPRGPRREDLDKIRELKASLADKSAKVDTLQQHTIEQEARLQQLHGELLLRERNYNGTFANGGAGARVLDVSNALSAEHGMAKRTLKQGESILRKGSVDRLSQRGSVTK